ncbi:SDR family oxidoreductase, partial [candidate division KSB1 bacterium]|nr:SDR family oxidoreductase [candidate division KSB1 bacterium]
MPEKSEGLEQLSAAQRALLAIKELRAKLEHVEYAKSEPIAVIGLGCRFPGGANSPREYWELLRAGRDAITEVPSERWDLAEYYDPNPEAPGKMYARHGGFIDDVDKFDPRFFGISPREAASMDPQQRLLLEVAWEALEHANIVPQTLHGSLTGVYLGLSTNDYSQAQAHHVDENSIDAYAGTGNAFSVASGRLSYTLGLQGPSLAVDTACSSSLVAVHLACQSLRNGETQLALAGGVNTMLSPAVTINFCKARMLAPDGRCKTFDEAADGYVRGEGCGIVVLKRLSDAERDGDHILALIRGSAVNQDGKSNGLTAPNGPAQEAVIQQALANAKVAANEVSYVEAHGTGTALGDPIEMRALGEIMRSGREHPLYVGSAKTNFGHLEAAAGIAGLIKVVLALHHAEIPAHLHFKKLSPHIAIDHIPAIIPTQLVPWPANHNKRLAGVSSFGFSGTNAHVILQGANKEKLVKEPSGEGQISMPQAPSSMLRVLTLSAKNEESLRALALRYAESSVFEEHALADVCFTANTKRSRFEHRLALLAESCAHAREQLTEFARGKSSSSIITGVAKNTAVRPKIAFLFTGQGAQYLDMGKQLYQTQPVFRAALQRCEELLRPYLDVPLLHAVFSDQSSVDDDQFSMISHQSPLNTDHRSRNTNHLLHQTAYTQPALFAIEYALAELWKSWGVTPSVVLGHSVGEYVAACVAGMFSLEDGLKLIAARARLMQALPQNGAMVALFVEERKAAAALVGYEDRVSIAAINDPTNVVISGEKTAVEEIVKKIEAQGVKSKALTVSHAFHSPLMEPMLDAFEKVVSEVTFHEPKIPIISNLTAQLLKFENRGLKMAERDPQSTILNPQSSIFNPRTYYKRHLREAVRFADSMRTLHEQGCKIFVELGPHPNLLGMGAKCLPEGFGVWLPSLRKGQEDELQMLKSLAGLHVNGVEIDWNNFHREEARVAVSLPTYAFKRERFWFEESASRKTKSAADTLKDWLYEINWQERPRRAQNVVLPPSTTWLIFAERSQLSMQLAQEMAQHGARAILVFAGEEFQQTPEGHFYLNPTAAENYERLLQHFAESNTTLAGVVHAWSLATEAKASLFGLEAAHDLSTGSALLLAQALYKAKLASKPRVWFITRGAQPVAQSSLPAENPSAQVTSPRTESPSRMPAIQLAQAPLWGFARVLALEHPELWGGIIDLELFSNPNEAAQILAELHSAEDEDQIALREDKRYVARLVLNKQIETKPLVIHGDASYLITGGLGNLGLVAARWLVNKGARYLVLTGRTGLPAREFWDEALTQEKFGNAINTIREMEKLGATIHIAKADVGNEEEVQQAWQSLPATLPALRGVIHAAGVSQATPIQQMSPELLRNVLKPKVTGTWLLHELTQTLELDFFVCYSSVSAIWGSQGLAHYAAANHFLDGFAHYRRALGLPAISLNWAQWEGESMASREAQASLTRMGLYSLPRAQALNALATLLASTATQKIIANVDWSTFKPVLEVKARRPLLEHLNALSPSNAQNASSEKSELLIALEEAMASEREAILARFVAEQAAKVLGLEASTIDPQKPLAEMGLDSLMAVELRNALALAAGKTLPSTLLFDFPTLEALCKYLLKEALLFDEEKAATPTSTHVIAHDEPIAIIGMACRFPGANDLDAYWRALHDGIDAITEVPASRWDLQQYYDPDPEAPGKMYCRFGGFIEQAEAFDPQFFGIAPREAQTMDPQQLLLLEVAWEAFEHAGIAPDKLSGSRTGVFLGMSSFEHTLMQAQHGDAAQADSFSGTSGGYSYAAGRLSYSFGLQGPCMTLDTACSSSLVAAHLACQSLRNGESNMALVAGVNVLLSPAWQVNICKARMLATDGRCKTFDESADGFVRSDGCGVVLLKRLSEAIADGDNVLALIRGSAVNQDGRSSGMTAPNGPAQEAVIRAALASANVQPHEVSFVETHGTGTALGDAIETRALSNVMSANRKADEPLFIGTVKSNLGHLEAASGVAGLIKLVLALQHAEIPQHLHFKKINLQIALEDWRMKIPTERTVWPAYNQRRIAGLSAFGLSGTNAHLVLEGAKKENEVTEPKGEGQSSTPHAPRSMRHLLALSAKTESALKELAVRYESHLGEQTETNLADFCFTANAGRSHFSHRLAITAANLEQARASLAAFIAGEETPSFIRNKLESFNRLKLGFLFASHGAYLGMGKRLFETQPVFRKTFEQCDAAGRESLQVSLCEVLYAEDAAKKFPAATIRLCAQPALFALEVSLAEMWKSWGASPGVVLGHETGEYASAVVAGVMRIEDALGLLALRARWNEARVQKAQSERERLQQEFEQHAHAVPYQAPRLTAIASLTGKVAKKGELTLPNYWIGHLQTSPDITEAFKTAYKQSVDFFIEIGPTSMLNDTLRASLPKQGANWLPSLMKQKDEWEIALSTLAKLYTHGAEVNWSGLHAGQTQRRLVLPTYPFQREVKLLRIEKEASARQVVRGKKADIAEWFYVPSWKRTPLPERARSAVFQTAMAGGDASATSIDAQTAERWLLFDDAYGLAAQLGARLEEQGHCVAHVHLGEVFTQIDERNYVVQPEKVEDYARLVEDLQAKGFMPEAVVYMRSIACYEQEDSYSKSRSFEKSLNSNFNELLYLAQALEQKRENAGLRFEIITSRLYDVVGENERQWEHAPLLALCKVIPQEFA